MPATGSADERSAGSGRTWWGRAWLEALEQRARLDPDRLPRGREYARDGAVGELTLAPGEARAQVRGRKTDPYTVRVRVRRFSDEEWDRVLAAISARLERAAALLDGELAPEVAQDTATAGIDLLPVGGELGPRCTCPDDADPCKHSAAACYLIADVLDADPFALFLLRGRTREQVMAGVRARRRADLGSPAGANGSADSTMKPAADPGVDARSAFSAPVNDRPVPMPVPPADRPGRPAPLPVDPPPWRTGLREDLIELAADAARRAWELAVGLSPDGGLALSPDADLARRASHALGTPSFARLPGRTGIPERDLARQALAWKHGAAHGLELLTTEWDPATADPDAATPLPATPLPATLLPATPLPATLLPATLLPAARQALAAKTGQTVTVRANQVSTDRLQLRLGRDLRWYPYTRSGTDWEPSGQPDPDPVTAIADL